MWCSPFIIVACAARSPAFAVNGASVTPSASLGHISRASAVPILSSASRARTMRMCCLPFFSSNCSMERLTSRVGFPVSALCIPWRQDRRVF